MHYIWIGLMGGLLAFPHCLGMCGGFVLLLARGQDRKQAVTGELLWLMGKTFTYAFLGGLAGFAGGRMAQLPKYAHIQNFISYATGGFILLVGLMLLGLMPVRRLSSKGIAEGFAAWVSRFASAAPAPGAALMLGIATGCLPCPIVFAFLALSFQSGSVIEGMATMAALGIGTTGALLLLGGATRVAGLHLRSWGARGAGIVLILLGLVTVLRGTEVYHELLGCPANPPLQHLQKERGNACCDNDHGCSR